MQLKANQLTDFLASKSNLGKFRLLWIYGDEPVLVDELANPIRQSISKLFISPAEQTTEERESVSREIISIDSQYPWHNFQSATQQASLFSEFQFFDLRMYINKINIEAVKILTDFTASSSEFYFVLITSPRIDSKQTSSKAFKKLSANSIMVPVWPLNKQAFINWLKDKAALQGLAFERQALEWLANQTEGNLLTAKQFIEQLGICYRGKTTALTLELLEKELMYAAKLNIFDILNKVYIGDVQQLDKQVSTLKAEGQLPIRILAAIQKELSLIAELKTAQANRDLDTTLKKLRIFGPKQSSIKRLIGRISQREIMQCFSLCHQLDQSIKGASKEDSWELLHHILFMLGGSPTLLEY